MRAAAKFFFTVTLFLTLLTGHASARVKGEILSTKMIWNQSPISRDTDIIRWKDRWFVVCCEMADEFSQGAALRVISSKDGDQWESIAQLKRPVPKASYRYDPAFTVRPDGKLVISALGMQTFAWSSEDGHTWSEPNRILPRDYEFSRDVWNKGVALKYAHGSYDGNSSTIQFLSSKKGQNFDSLFEKTFEFIPDDGAVIFDGDRAYCVISRQATNPIPQSKELGRQFQTGLLGTADAPYTVWEWKSIDAPICVPNLLRLPDGRTIAAVGMSNKADRITLCEFDLSTGKLTEFLELPVPIENLIQARYHRQVVGLAHHEGNVWVSYHATHNGKLCVHLAKVKLVQQ